jgi:hypothetical protein
MSAWTKAALGSISVTIRKPGLLEKTTQLTSSCCRSPEVYYDSGKLFVFVVVTRMKKFRLM